MTFYDAFADEISKIAEEEEKKRRAPAALAALHYTSGAAALGGLGAEMAGDIAKDRALGGRGKGPTPRPKWSHPAKKWGRRVKRGGMAGMIPGMVWALGGGRKSKDKEGKK